MPLAPETEPTQINECDRMALIEMFFDGARECPQPFAIKSVSRIRNSILATFRLPRLLFAGIETIEDVCRCAGASEGTDHQWFGAHAKLNFSSSARPIIVGLVDLREVVCSFSAFDVAPGEHERDGVCFWK